MASAWQLNRLSLIGTRTGRVPSFEVGEVAAAAAEAALVQAAAPRMEGAAAVAAVALDASGAQELWVAALAEAGDAGFTG